MRFAVSLKTLRTVKRPSDLQILSEILRYDLNEGLVHTKMLDCFPYLKDDDKTKAYA